MPQTREHLSIVDLLGVSRGAVALTKIDRVAPERVAEVRAAIPSLLENTRFAGAPLFPLSSVTGSGIAALLAHLEDQATHAAARKSGAHFRLAVDRCFSVAGAGLVVTGTALSGEVAVGDEVKVLLAESAARVRSIHAHNRPVERASAGQRLALNLAGLEPKARVARGDWIVRGELPPPVLRFDARLSSTEPIRHWTPVHVHLGAADVLGRVAHLDDNGLVQIVLEQPMGAVAGDRFILRDTCARRTLGGGRVIDVFAPRRGRARPHRLAQLRAMEADDDAEALAALLACSPDGVDLGRFAVNRNSPERRTGWAFAPAHWQALRERIVASIGAWHVRFPDAVGPAADRIVKGVDAGALQSALDELAREGRVVREPLGVRLSSHRADMAPADAALWKKAEPLLAGARPPTVAELAAALAEDPKTVEAVLSRAGRRGLVIRVARNRFFLPPAVARLETIAQALADEGMPITAAAFRDRAGIGRNLSIEVLEYFDRIRFTRRVGDTHVLRNPQGRESHPGGARGLQIR